MVKALTVGVSVLAGILIGRIQMIENHDANDAIAASKHAEKRAGEAKRDAIRTRALLDATERQLVDMWQRLEPMLDDLAHADSVISRESARQKIQMLRWEMSSATTTVKLARELSGQDKDQRTALRQVVVKENFGQ